MNKFIVPLPGVVILLLLSLIITGLQYMVYSDQRERVIVQSEAIKGIEVIPGNPPDLLVELETEGASWFVTVKDAQVVAAYLANGPERIIAKRFANGQVRIVIKEGE